MADPRLVWRQLAAPDFTGAARIMSEAGKSLDAGFAAAGGVVERYRKGQQENADNALLADLARIKNEKEYDNFIAAGGLNNVNISDKMREYALGMRRGFADLESVKTGTAATRTNTGLAVNRDNRAATTHELAVGETKDAIAKRNADRAAAGIIGNALTAGDALISGTPPPPAGGEMPPGMVGAGAGPRVDGRSPVDGATTPPPAGGAPAVTVETPIDFSGPKARANAEASAAARALADPTAPPAAGGSTEKTTANNSNWAGTRNSNVTIVGNYGPNSRASADAAGRGPEANEDVRNLAANAAEAVFGAGSKIIVNSGFRTKGAAAGRHPEGKAMDIVIVDPSGKQVSINDPRMREFVMVGGAMGLNSVGAGKGYMGQYAIHVDTADHGGEGMRAWAELGNAWENDFNRVRKEGYTYNGVYYNRAGNAAAPGNRPIETSPLAAPYNPGAPGASGAGGAARDLVSAPPVTGPQGDTRAFRADVDRELGITGPGVTLDSGPGITFDPLTGRTGMSGDLPPGLGRENDVGVPTDPVAAAVARVRDAQNASEAEAATNAGIVPPIPAAAVRDPLSPDAPTVTGGGAVRVAGDGTITTDPTVPAIAEVDTAVREAEDEKRENLAVLTEEPDPDDPYAVPLSAAPTAKGNTVMRRNLSELKSRRNAVFNQLAATGRFTADEINSRLSGLDTQISDYEKQIRANEAVVREDRVTGAIASIIDDAENVTEADLRKAVRNHPDYVRMSHTEREQFRAGVLAAAQADPNRVRNAGIEANADVVDNGDNLVRVATERLRADPVGQVLMDSERYKNEDNSINLDNFYADLELDSEDDIKDNSFWTYIGLSGTPSRDWKQGLRNKINKLSQETGLPPEVVMTIMRDQFQRSRFFQDSMDRRFEDDLVRKAAPTFSATARTEYRTKRNLIKKMEKEFEGVERKSQALRQRIAKLELTNPDDPRIDKWKEEDKALIAEMAEIARGYKGLLKPSSDGNDGNRGTGGTATVNRRDPAVAGIVGRESAFQ